MCSIWQLVSWWGNIKISMIQHTEKLDSDDSSLVSANLNNSEPGCSSPQDEGNNFYSVELSVALEWLIKMRMFIYISDSSVDFIRVHRTLSCQHYSQRSTFTDMLTKAGLPVRILLTCGSPGWGAQCGGELQRLPQPIYCQIFNYSC